MNEETVPHVARIAIYPIKSLEPMPVESVQIYTHGMLEGDRTFALFEGFGDIFKAKSKPELHRLHVKYDAQALRASFRIAGQPDSREFHLDEDRAELNEWLSQVFDRPIRFHGDRSFGFADDWTATGPTLVSSATIETIASWFDELTVDDVRRRLRANIEVDGVPPFWEDQLYGPNTGDLVRFRIGEVELFGKNACQRCPIPARDVETGETNLKFARVFVKNRKESLPEWAHLSRFDNFYKAAINTQPASISEHARIGVGDKLEILQLEPLSTSTS